MVSQGHSKIGELTSMLIMCHEMKWDYWTFLKQPTWFVEGLRTKMVIEAKTQNIKQKEAHRKMNTKKR